MKRMLVILLLLIPCNIFAQGAFADKGFKSMIGKVYRDQQELTELSGYTSRGGTLLSDINAIDKLTGSWFSKGTTFVALFEKVNDDNMRLILDVLVIKNCKANQELKIGECRDGDKENAGIVALTNTVTTERVKALKAWNFNLDKVKIEAFSATNVSCLAFIGDD